MTPHSKWIKKLFLLGLVFLWVRNAPLAVLLPIWSFGDEIAHLDYLMKVSRGQLPKIDDRIEPDVFNLHREHYDAGYISSTRRMSFETPADLGLAGYSYEAPHPPLPYLILAAARLPMRAVGMPLLTQVKGLRLVSLLAMSVGLFIVYCALCRRNDLGLLWYSPLLLIPLLAQDIFVSINTDAFTFMFGCGVVWALFWLMERPAASRRWAVLSLAVIFAIWTKITCAFFLALWPVLAVSLVWKNRGKKEKCPIAALAALFFVVAALFSSPWYLLNKARNKHLVGFQFELQTDIPYQRYEPPNLNWKEAKTFKNAFGRTLTRGEMLWNGTYVGDSAGPMIKVMGDAVFWLFFAAGLLVVFPPARRVVKNLREAYFILAAAGLGVIVSLFVLHFAWGGIPFYHARYAFAGLYPIMLIFAAGSRLLIPRDMLAVVTPALMLLAVNLFLTAKVYVLVFT